jgi:SAM-dependent methyltransferase
MIQSIRQRFVKTFWAAHNDSPAVRREIRSLLGDWRNGRGLNVGCGDTRLDPRMINVDLFPTPAVGIIGDTLALPFADNSFSLVVSQETVEHVSDPFLAVREMARVLAPNGTLYLQAPFVIGYHPGPEDYWRFSRAGIRRLIEQAGMECRRVEPAVGSGTGLYRITVEFFAAAAARIAPALYRPIKAVGSVFFFPITWWNGFLSAGTQSDRIPGGYFAIGIKKKTA